MNSEKIDQLLNWINDLSDKTEAEVEELRVKLLNFLMSLELFFQNKRGSLDNV